MHGQLRKAGHAHTRTHPDKYCHFHKNLGREQLDKKNKRKVTLKTIEQDQYLPTACQIDAHTKTASIYWKVRTEKNCGMRYTFHVCVHTNAGTFEKASLSLCFAFHPHLAAVLLLQNYKRVFLWNTPESMNLKSPLVLWWFDLKGFLKCWCRVVTDVVGNADIGVTIGFQLSVTSYTSYSNWS